MSSFHAETLEELTSEATQRMGQSITSAPADYDPFADPFAA